MEPLSIINKYGSKKNPKETVDFLVKKDRTLILIEVK